MKPEEFSRLVKTIGNLIDERAKTTHIDYDPQKVTFPKIEEVLEDTGYAVAK